MKRYESWGVILTQAPRLNRANQTYWGRLRVTVSLSLLEVPIDPLVTEVIVNDH